MRKEVPLELATRIINHGPVVLVGSMCEGKVNVTPVAWNMPVQKKPPMLVLEIGENHHIFKCIMETGDFVVNVPSAEMAENVVKCGSVSGRDEDKIALCGFQLIPARTIKTPMLSDALASLECVLVKDKHLLEEYNMVVGEVKYAEAMEDAFGDFWNFGSGNFKTLHHLGNKVFAVPSDGVIDLR